MKPPHGGRTTADATVARMRTIGHREIPLPSGLPHADALRRAAVHQATGMALAAMPSTGIAHGVYRFGSHGEAQRQADEALARVMAANAAAQKRLR